MFPGENQDSGLLRPYHSTLVLLQRLADVCMIVLAHVLAVRLYDGAVWEPAYTVAATSAGLVFMFAAEAFGLYRGFRGVPPDTIIQNDGAQPLLPACNHPRLAF